MRTDRDGLRSICKSGPAKFIWPPFMFICLLSSFESLAIAWIGKEPDSGADWAAFHFGDWTVIASRDSSEAGTANEGGDAFGFACSDSCVHYIDLHTECRNGADYVATATIGQRRFSLGLTCYVSEGQFVFLADMSPQYLSALGAGQLVSISVTFDDEQTKNADFSLKGCRQATLAAAELAPATVRP